MADPEDELEGLQREVHSLRSMIERQRYAGGSRVWDGAIKGMVPVVLAVGAWGIGHEVRLSNLEQTGMSREAGHLLEARVMRSLAPQWLKDDIQEIKQRLRDQDEAIREIRKQLNR